MHLTNTDSPAALPWYRFPETQPILDAIWKDVASELRAAGVEHPPEFLDHTTPHKDLLGKASLTLSQCCGPDLFEDYAIDMVPFAAPVISAYDVAPGYYFSYIVTGKSGVTGKSAEFNSPRVVINSRTSHSGCTAVKLWLDACGIEEYTVYESGSHSNSVRELQAGRANIAAIDALSWRFLDARDLNILDNSEPVIAPPFIAGLKSTIPTDLMRPMLDRAFKRHGEPLGITGLVPITKSDYRQLSSV